MNFEIETINKLLNSENYQERMVGEFLELTVRLQKLQEFLTQYRENKLPFTPATSYDMMHEQFVHMKNYHTILTQRLQIENIDIEKWASDNKDKEEVEETTEN